MSDRDDFSGLHLPDDLRALDEELSSIRYEERPSFGPELRAELAGALANRRSKPPSAYRRLAAAGVAGLLVGGAAVPSARASLVRLFDVLSPDAAVVAEPRIRAPVDVPPPLLPPVAEPADDEEDAVTLPLAPPSIAPDEDLVTSEPPIPPQMLDRGRAEMLLQQAYPLYLQRRGIGGQLSLRLWVDANGNAGLANVSRGSGVRDLDRAAIDIAPLLRFEPAMRGGTPFATWIEFPVVFTPDRRERNATGTEAISRLTQDPMRLPIVHPDDQWEFDEPLDLSSLPVWRDEPASPLTAAEAALVEAIGDPMVRRSLGPVGAILAGIAPEGRAPTEWRTSAVAVLESVIARNGQNPAPLLALARIRLRQGLRTEALMLFERGLQIAIQNGSSVSPVIFAELHHERGRLIKESWLGSHQIGRVRAQAFAEAQCEQARSSGRAASGFASVERMIAWNYLCPAELDRVFDVGFEPSDDGVADLSLMTGSFRAAIDASAGHVGSNVGLLVALADAERWEDVLAGARRFVRTSGGHPYALLLAGLAHQKLARGEEAEQHFAVALDRLPQAEADEIRDITFVIDRAQIDEYRRLWGEQRRAWEEDFWATKDRTLTTAVNERAVEHLARSTYALLRFGSVTSDPGEVWVRFGGPNTVHVVDEGSGQLTEFWDYGSGPDITFVRWVASRTMDLTREGRAYVDDLGKIYPPQ